MLWNVKKGELSTQTGLQTGYVTDVLAQKEPELDDKRNSWHDSFCRYLQ